MAKSLQGTEHSNTDATLSIRQFGLCYYSYIAVSLLEKKSLNQ